MLILLVVVTGHRVGNRLGTLTKLLFHLTSIVVARVVLLLLVGLHEVGQPASSLVKHLLTVLRILTHHLMVLVVLFLLLELVVEGLELVVLRGV